MNTKNINTKKLKIAPSMLSANYSHLAESVALCESCGADILHVDVMDGHFVPNITIGPLVVKALRPLSKLPIDCHLMIEKPENFIPQFIEAGADMISIHAETGYHHHRTLSMITGAGKSAGIALNPLTPLCHAFEAAEYVDFILLMSVNPGFGGQRFIPSFLRRCEELRNFLDTNGRSEVEIQVDGGITPDNIHDVYAAGANIIVAGSALFTGDFKSNIERMRQAVR